MGMGGNGGFGRSQGGFQMPGNTGGFGVAGRGGGMAGRGGYGNPVGGSGMTQGMNPWAPQGANPVAGGATTFGGGIQQMGRNAGGISGMPQMSQPYSNSSPPPEQPAPTGPFSPGWRPGTTQPGFPMGSGMQFSNGGTPLIDGPRGNFVGDAPTGGMHPYQPQSQANAFSGLGGGASIQQAPSAGPSWMTGMQGEANGAQARAGNVPPGMAGQSNAFGAMNQGGGGRLGSMDLQNPNGGQSWNGLDAMDNLTGTGEMMFTPSGANQYFSTAALGQNKGLGANMWITDPTTGQVVAGDPNGSGFAQGLGNLNARGLDPSRQYKLNYSGGNGPFRISGNRR